MSPQRPRNQRPRNARPTLSDVAQRAGVALSTASLVFSGNGPVATATEARVREAAAALGFHGPDPRAAALRSGRNGAVAVMLDDRLLYAFRDPCAIAILDGLAAVLDTIPAGMLLLSSMAGHETGHAQRQLAAASVDALVFPLCLPTDPALSALARNRGIPVVAAGPPQRGVVTVTIDERGSARRIAQHVAGLGHTRVAHVTLPHLSADETVQRSAGFTDVFGAHAHTVNAAGVDIDHGITAGHQLLDVPAARRPTAVIAQADVLAAGVIRAAEDLGLTVPTDVSVTGFDGVTVPGCAHILTTIDQHPGQKGQLLGQAVAGLLAGRRVRSRHLETDVRLGTTTASPSGGTAR